MTEIDTSPAALRCWAQGAANNRNERAIKGSYLEWWHVDLFNLLNALAAEKEARAEKAEAERDAAQRWRPIETAPRDGTLIDIWAGERLANCAWNVPSNCWAERIGAGFGGKHWAFVSDPTYWMPLPAAPANPEDPAHD